MRCLHLLISFSPSRPQVVYFVQSTAFLVCSCANCPSICAKALVSLDKRFNASKSLDKAKLLAPIFFVNSRNSDVLPMFFEEPVEMFIPCFCNLLESDSEFFFASEDPDHAFSKSVYEIAEKIDKSSL